MASLTCGDYDSIKQWGSNFAIFVVITSFIREKAVSWTVGLLPPNTPCCTTTTISSTAAV
eukprot:m.23053 g.23053  ORF g.23053 m.23053 type:complete len:60 (-) comp13077_c0_seq1:212-391(-)